MDAKEKDIKEMKTNTLIDLYKEVEDFISFLRDELKKTKEEG